MEQSSRVRFSPAELLKRYLEVQKVPEALLKEMTEPPLSHLISHYYVKPVNFDPNPFAPPQSYHHNQQHGAKPGYNNGQQQSQFQRGGYKRGGAGQHSHHNQNEEGQGFSRSGPSHHQQRRQEEGEDSDEFEVVENKQKPVKINKIPGTEGGFQKGFKKPTTGAPTNQQTQPVIQRPQTQPQPQQKSTLPQVPIQDWTQPEKTATQPVTKSEPVITQEAPKVVVQEVPQKVAPKQDVVKAPLKSEEKPTATAVKVEEAPPTWAQVFEQSQPKQEGAKPKPAANETKKQAEPVKKEQKPKAAAKVEEIKPTQEETKQKPVADEVKPVNTETVKKAAEPAKEVKGKKKGQDKKQANPEVKPVEEPKKAVKFSEEPPKVQEAPKSETAPVEEKPFSWDSLSEQFGNQTQVNKKKQADHVFNMPELSGLGKEEKKSTPSANQKKELTLDDIMREQELEAKRQVADKKRRELQKKSDDPLALNYIKPSLDDIFVNAKAAKQALAPTKASPSLDQIMKEQQAQTAAKKTKK